MKPGIGADQKILGLEALRFLAAMAVLVWHYQHFAYVGDQAPGFERTAQPFYDLLRPMYEHGRYGVQVFWIISGYIFFWKYRDVIADRTIHGVEFMKLRFSRLYPLHFVTLLLVATLQLAYAKEVGLYYIYPDQTIGYFFLHLFLASEWGFMSTSGFNHPVWSVSLEVLVYFLFFMVLRWLGRAWIWNVAIVALCVTATALQVKPMVVQCALFFYAGGIVAVVQPHLAPHRRLATLACVATLAALVFAGLTVDRLQSLKPSHWIMLGMPPLLLLVCWHFRAPSALHKGILAAGNMTYSSYLLHFPLQLGIALAYACFDESIPYTSTTFFVAFMAGLLVLAHLTFIYFEMPMQKLIRGTPPAAKVQAVGA